MALVLGFLIPKQVSDWADRQLLSRSTISEEIIELSLSARLPFSQIIKNLNLYQGAHDYGLPLNLVLAHAGVILDGDPAVAPMKLWLGLRLLLAEDNLPATVRQRLLALEDNSGGLELQKTDPSEFRNEIRIFLSPYQEWRDLLGMILETELPTSD